MQIIKTFSLKIWIELLWLIVLIQLFVFSSPGVSSSIIWLCLITFYYYFLNSIKKPISIHKNIPTYLKLDILFMLFFYILFYLPYQFYVFGLADLNKSLFISETFVNYTTPSILASTIGLSSFMLGYQFNFKKNQKRISEELSYDKMHFIVLVCMLFFLVLFMATSFKAMLAGTYGGSNVGNVTENGIYFLVTHFAMLIVAITVCYLYQKKKIPIILFFSCLVVLFWCLLLLVMGDRNNFFIIALIGAVGLFTYIRKIKLLGVATTILIALSIYNVVEISRTAEDRSFEAIVEVVTSDKQESRSILEGSFYNTTITSRAAIALVPKKHPYFNGKFKLIGIAGIIPFSRSLFVDKNDQFTTSADFLTFGILGGNATWSVGTNIISDIYLDFGILGVAIIMYLVGLFGKYVQHQTIENQYSMKWAVLYLIVVALFTELPRYTLSFPLRNIVWTILIFYIYKITFKNKKREEQQ